MALSDYSGIIVNQNAVPEDSLDVLPLGSDVAYFQTFELPDDFPRADAVLPDLTGLQVFITVSEPVTAGLTWELARYDGTDWSVLTTGTTTGTAVAGNVWFNVVFPTAVRVNPTWLGDLFRIAVLGHGGADSVSYSVPNPLSTGQALQAAIAGNLPSTTNYPSELNFLSVTSANFPSLTNWPSGSNYPIDFTSTEPVSDNGRGVSLMFRLLASVADSGTDFLGNLYRSAAITSEAENVSPLVLGGVTTYWLSQPTPSSFAVQSMYLDMRERGSAIVADRFTLDPITPGVTFHVYYSNDPLGPGLNTSSWDDLLWTPVYKTFVADRMTTYALPEPITAKYIKVEFSNLQAHTYNPGDFQLPTTYKKHPSWVLAYFDTIFGLIKPDLMPSGLDITYDALDLAYSYYSGDIIQDPAAPALSQNLTAQQARFVQQEVFADIADTVSLNQINLDLQPFTSPPALSGSPNSLLSTYVSSVATDNYSTEEIQVALGDTSVVSNLQREALLVEKGFPLMFFYLPCRHAYRVVQALFEKNIGYFAGVNSLVFHREICTGRRDRLQINENLGDGANLLINDWIG